MPQKALSYLIGADLEDIADDDARITEVPYDDPRVGSGDNIAYCNLFHENYEDDGPIYEPYLPDDDVSGQYNEGRIDPRGAGWRRNLDRQYALRRAQGHTIIELDNPDSYDAYFDYVMEEVENSGFLIIAKNPVLLSLNNALRYVSHPNVIGIIVERGMQSVALLDLLRKDCDKPNLPIWFVAFDLDGHGVGWSWANKMAEQVAGLGNVGVTYSEYGEYVNVEDVLPYQSSIGAPMKIVISSGHGKYIRGASGYLDEVNEARRVVEQTAAMLRHIGVGVETFHDNTSHDQSTNLNTIVNYHNARTRDLDVSVHFNAYQTTSKPMGVECLYVTQQTLAADVSSAIADSGHFLDRGPKKRTDLFFLNNTNEPAILIETCFVDSSADADLYRNNFDAICQSIAESVSGQAIGTPPEQPPDRPPINPPDRPPTEPPTSGSKPVLGIGDEGPYVVELQSDLNIELEGCNLTADGDFGSLTEEAVYDYQRSRGLDADGVVGEQTWNALDTHMPPYIPPGLPAPLTSQQQEVIAKIAIQSRISGYSWRDRGLAPDGYVKGFALAWANTYRQWQMGYGPAVEMAKKNSGNSEKDVLQWYYTQYRDANMDNTRDGADTLRHLWALLMGLGMRESSGQHCCGRDQSADNVSSDTAEAGLFQTSYNAHSCSSKFDELFNAFSAASSTDNPQGFMDYFSEDVSCSSSDWQNYGSGNGAKFQDMCKKQPAFACETCAIVLRKLRQHYGPINREEAELKSDADVMLKQVQDWIDANLDRDV